MIARTLTLSLLPLDLCVCRFAAGAEIPQWATQSEFFCVMRTAEELSLVCPLDAAPAEAAGACVWRALKLHGPFAFDETGILESVLQPLALAGVGIFALSTYDTDYVLIREPQMAVGIAAIRAAGHAVMA